MLLSLVFACTAFFSCTRELLPGIRGTGDIAENTVVLDDFTGFVSAISADVFVSQGAEQEVVIKAQQNIIDNIELDVRNGIWTIKYNEWVLHAKPVRIYVTIPVLTKAAISGSGDITGMTDFTGLDHLDLVISGSGSIGMESETNELNVVISGAGDIDLSGSTKELDIQVSGSGSIDAYSLESKEAAITISGSGNAFLDVSSYLNVLISGSGSVYYRGDPEIETTVSGSGRIVKDR
jgi:hypothetical protein